MTIALGILCLDGFVIAADSEYSDANYMAFSQTKIMTCWASNGEGDALIVTGAGDASYMEAAFSDLDKFFADNPGLEIQAIEDNLRRYIRTFYKTHVLPFAAYGNQRPDIWLIIGARVGSVFRLWTTSHNKLTRCQIVPYTCVGTGSTYARSILGRVFNSTNVEIAKLLAAYVIYLVKERIPECGKETHIQGIKIGSPYPLGFTNRQTRALEVLFGDYGRLEAMLLHGVLGNDQDFADLTQLQKSFEILKQAIYKTVNHPSSQ
jgi:hypothetical protein